MDSPKSALRTRMKALRRAVSPEDRQAMDRAVCERLVRRPEIRDAQTVCLYASLADEVDTWLLAGRLWACGRITAFPRVEDGGIAFYRVGSRQDLVPGFRGIWEPSASCPRENRPDAPVIVPGLAFSPQGARLGYGGGYYDRFFAGEPGHRRIAAAYPFQIVETLPAEAWDRMVDVIVTPEQEYEIRRDQ